MTTKRAPAILGFLAGAAVLVAACGGGTASPSASESSGQPSALASNEAPSSTPSQAAPAANPGGKITVGSLATVATNNLRVRSKPSVAADSTKLKPQLDKGRVVYVVSGPTKGSGYTWYRVQPLRQDGDTADLPLGWIASADKDGTPWLTADAPPCPGKPGDYGSFAHTTGLAALACFKGDDITFQARLESPEATCGVDIGWSVEPEWLGSTCPQPKFLLADTDSTESVNAIIDPKVNTDGFKPGVEESQWTPVTVTGRYDHPAAKDCKGVSTDGSTKVPRTRAEIVLGCRATFVITAIAPRS